ncbi:MAG TPA: hypothetical protein VMG12_13195 [Polyangiaceae bacterium]|nr:hypothetical protein [Polyangiaceae bacterium]
MTAELKDKIKRLYINEGLGVVAITKALDVPVETVREALGLHDDGSAVPPVERPALPAGKGRSQASLDIAAAARMQAELARRTRRSRRSFL